MIRILLADDQKLFVESLKIVLTMLAKDIAVVGIAINGSEAMDMASQLAPDVVLMDVRMPKMDGVEAVRMILQNHPQIRIMMLTTFDDDDYVLDALNYGAVGYILKDLSPEELIISIRAVHGGTMIISPSVARKALLYTQSIGRVGHETAEDMPSAIDAERELRHPSGIRLQEHPALKFLTSREIEVLHLIGLGYVNKEIADRLFISLQTVKNHVSTIYSKLNMHSRVKVAHFTSTLEHFLDDMNP